MNSLSSGHECYGKMFPDFTRLRFQEPLDSKVFAALVVSSEEGARGRSLKTKREAWEQCVECPDYRTCYDLSFAALLTMDILMHTTWVNPWVGESAQPRTEVAAH